MNRTLLLLGTALAAAHLVACDQAFQNFGPAAGGGAGEGGGDGVGGSAGSDTGGGGDGTGGSVIAGPFASRFRWLAPRPHGNDFRAFAATSDDDVWLGGRGAILAWDGNDWTSNYPSADDVAYHALWVRSAGDVWAGGTKLVWRGDEESEEPALFHREGATWRSIPIAKGRTLQVLGGNATTGYLALDGGEIRRFASGDFTADAKLDGEIRAIWASGADDAWAVGDGGFVARRTSAGWARVDAALAGAGEPFGADHNYLGVWGAAPNDVWATFETAKLDGAWVNVFTDGPETEIGFAHFDGTSWSVTKTAQANCAEYAPSGVFSVDGLHAVHAFNQRGAFETRRGSLITGRSGADVIASVGAGRCLWRYDGADWSPVFEQFGPDPTGVVSDPIVNFPLGDAPVVGATASTLFVSGQAGRAISFDPGVDYEPGPPVEISPAMSDLFPAGRASLTDVFPSSGGTYALGNGRPVVWSAHGWTELVGPEGSLDPVALAGGRLGKLHVDRAGNVWVFGGLEPLVAARWDGTAWSAVDLEQIQSNGFVSVWSSGPDDVWLSTTFAIQHLVDGRFVKVDVPVPEGEFASVFENLDGDGPDDVWVTVSIDRTDAPNAHRTAIYRYDGHRFAEALRLPTYRNDLLRAFAKDDVVALEDHESDLGFTLRRFDGKRWTESEIPPPPTTMLPLEPSTILIAAPNAIFGLGSSTTGQYLLEFDGTAWIESFGGDGLRELGGGNDELWLVGEGGATVKADLVAPPK